MQVVETAIEALSFPVSEMGASNVLSTDCYEWDIPMAAVLRTD